LAQVGLEEHRLLEQTAQTLYLVLLRLLVVAVVVLVIQEVV
jgi:hypothetical protein